MVRKIALVGLVVLCSFFVAAAQVFYKLGSQRLSFDVMSLLTNYPLLIGVILYGLGGVLFITALKRAQLSVVFPLLATSYIWVALLSFFMFAEPISLMKGGGIAVVIVGVTLVGMGGE